MVQINLIWILSCLAQLSDGHKSPFISGVVLNSVNSQPISGVTVFLEAESKKQDLLRGAKSGTDGKFIISNVVPGEYRLRLQHKNFIAHEYGQARVGDTGEVLSIKEPLIDITIRMVPNGVIAGRITDPSGEPLANAMVQVAQTRFLNGKVQRVPLGVVVTNDLGEYRFFNLPPGRYLVESFYRDTASIVGALPTNIVKDEIIEDFAVTYYPGSLSPSGASLIALSPGQSRSGVDIRLARSRSLSIEGRVDNIPSGASMARVFLQPRDGGALGPHQVYVLHDGDNRFHFKSVPIGEYSLRADASVGNSQYKAVSEVTLSDRDVQSIVLSYQPLFTVKGVVSQENGKPLPENLSLKVIGTERPSMAELKLKLDGQFSLPNFGPDRYIVSVNESSGDFFVKAISIGGQAVQGQPFNLERDSSINVVISDKAGRISGVLIDRDNLVSKRVIILLSESEMDQVITIVSDDKGKFERKGLRPGRYRIGCFVDIEAADEITTSMLAEVRGSGENITVMENGSVQIDLSVRKTPSD